MDVPDRPHGEALSPAAQVALAYRAVVRETQTLSPSDSEAYRTAVRVLRRVEGRERKWIAQLLRISPSAVTKLVGRRADTVTEGAAA